MIMGNDFEKELSDRAAHIEEVLKAILPKEEG